MNKKLFISLAMTAMLFTACNSSDKKAADATDTTTEANVEAAEGEAAAEMPSFEDFKQTSIEGNEVSALEFIKSNKLTIVDFWASWCPPCVREIPNIKAIYGDYKDKGLGILSISLDNEESAWKDSVKKFEMDWTHVSDLKGWENAAAQQYGVQSIPFMMLVDAEGKIVAQDVRGEALKNFVEEYFK